MNRFRSLCFAALVAVTVAAATANAAPQLAGYAPPGTDLIVRLNGPKIVRSRAFALIRESRNFRKTEEDMRNELAKSGMTMEALLNTDVLLFTDTGKFDIEKPFSFMVVARNQGNFADLVLKRVGALCEEDVRAVLKKDPIGGREARLYKDDEDTIAAIALDKSCAAVLWNVVPVAVPVLRQPGELARRMDPDALICIVFKNDKGVNRDIFEQLPPVVEPFLVGAVAAVADLQDGGDRLILKAELVYATVERAQDVAAQLNGMLLVGMMSMSKKKPARAAILKKFRVTLRERTVVIDFACRNDKLARAFLDMKK